MDFCAKFGGFLVFFQGTGGQHISVGDAPAYRGQPEAGGDVHIPRGGEQRVGTRRELAAHQGGHAARTWVRRAPGRNREPTAFPLH